MGVTGGGGEGDQEKEGGDQDEFPQQHQEGAQHRPDGEEEEVGPPKHQGLHLHSTFKVKILFDCFIPHPEFECYEAVKTFSNLYFLLDQDDVDPEQFWEIIGELGDGAFGKVISKFNNFKEFKESKINFTPIASFWSFEMLMRKRLNL